MPATIYNRVKGNITPLSDHILIVNMEKGETITKAGLILMDDNGKDRGIRPRWAQVYKVGKNVDYVSPGQWVLIEHGRWTYGIELEIPEGGPDEIFYVQRADPNGILLVTDECPL